MCPTGGYCPANASAVTPCPAGTYRSLTGGWAGSQCAPCPLGQACAAPGLAAGVNCSAGAYANATGLSACLACPPGTLNGPSLNTTGRTAVCPACPGYGFYCPSPTAPAVACPATTNSSSAGGASNILACVCNPGFVCGYYKTITVTFSLANVSFNDFTHDVNGIQTSFIASVAAAAGVDVGSVSVLSVTAGATTARRLLRLEQPAAANNARLSVRLHIRPPAAAPDRALQRLQARPDYDGHHVA